MGLRNLFSRRRRVAKPAGLAPASPSGTNAAAPISRPGDGHTVRAYGEALNALVTQVLQMGDHVVRMVEECTQIFLDRDLAAAKLVIQSDLTADRQKDALFARSWELLARQQPVASDLRLILAVQHVTSELERSADHAKNIAKRALTLPQGGKLDPTMRDLLLRLHEGVCDMLVVSLRALKDADATVAADLRGRDRTNDSVYDDLFHTAIARIQADPSDAAADVQTLFAGKSLERIGDHATNIAEEAAFIVAGDIPRSTRPH